MISPGRSTSEHARAWRAEVLGFALAVAGVPLHDHVLCAVGAGLVAVTAAAYAFARGGPKAAAVRRPADQATRRV